MRLNKATAEAFRKELESRLLCGVAEGAARYKENGLTFKRFMWDCYHGVGHKKLQEIITSNNAEVQVIGGYMANVKDSHIETMLKNALNDVAY